MKHLFRICLVTGSRAEYGILKPLIQRLTEDSDIVVEIIATAMHLEKKYGSTYKNIENDGFPIVKKIPLHLQDTSKSTVVASISRLQLALSEHFEEVDYDLIIILGDRYEMLAVSNVALIYNIPVCHLHGGEKTLGNFDEYIRHAITKMSHLHLVSTQEYRNRVIQMGEHPDSVIHTGSLGVENALSLPQLERRELESRLGMQLSDSYYVVLFHPVTLEEADSPREQIESLLSALQEVGGTYIFIGSNSDTGSDDIMQAVNEFVTSYESAYIFSSLSTQEYHSLVRYSQGLIGNSSSGLIEVPSLEKPTLNIGNRQKGRLAGPSVLHVEIQKEAIQAGIVSMKEVTEFENPYWKASATETAYYAIKKALLDGITTKKDFYDRIEVE